MNAPPTNVTLPFRARSGGATHVAVQWNTGGSRTTVPLRRSRPLALSEFISAPGTAGGFAPKPARRKVNLPGNWGVREKDFSYEVLRVLARRRALKYSAACPRASSIGLWVWGTLRSSAGG